MITVSTDVLSLALDKLYQAIDKKVGLEELRTIQIKAKGGSITLAARNRTAGGQAYISENVLAKGEFYFGISAGYFRDIVSRMEKGGQISIVLESPYAIISDERSKFRLNYYTEIPPLEDLDLKYAPSDISKLMAAFKRVYFPDTMEDINSKIKGVYIDNENIVSTNRWCLNMLKNDILRVKSSIRIGEDSIKRMIGVFSKLGPEGGVYETPHALALHAGGFYFRTLLLPESYPDYKRLIPKKPPSLCVVDKYGFMSALNRVLVISETKAVNIEIEEQNMHLSCSGAHGNSSETLECESNVRTSLSISGKLLLDTLSRLEESSVSMELRKTKTDGSPEVVLFKERDFISAIAPIAPQK